MIITFFKSVLAEIFILGGILSLVYFIAAKIKTHKIIVYALATIVIGLWLYLATLLFTDLEMELGTISCIALYLILRILAKCIEKTKKHFKNNYS